MRLINADEIVYEETLRCAGHIGNCSTYYHDRHVWDGDIDKMPTVEAIPIKWLYEQSDNPDRSDRFRNACDLVAMIWLEEREEE